MISNSQHLSSALWTVFVTFPTKTYRSYSSMMDIKIPLSNWCLTPSPKLHDSHLHWSVCNDKTVPFAWSQSEPLSILEWPYPLLGCSATVLAVLLESHLFSSSREPNSMIPQPGCSFVLVAGVWRVVAVTLPGSCCYVCVFKGILVWHLHLWVLESEELLSHLNAQHSMRSTVTAAVSMYSVSAKAVLACHCCSGFSCDRSNNIFQTWLVSIQGLISVTRSSLIRSSMFCLVIVPQ